MWYCYLWLFVGPHPRWWGCCKVCYGHIISTSGFTIWSSNAWLCLLSSIAEISEMSLSGSSTSALASSSGRSRTIDTSISPPSFWWALVGLLGLVQDGECLVSANTSLPFFCCPKRQCSYLRRRSINFFVPSARRNLLSGSRARVSTCSTRCSEDIICRESWIFLIAISSW